MAQGGNNLTAGYSLNSWVGLGCILLETLKLFQIKTSTPYFRPNPTQELLFNLNNWDELQISDVNCTSQNMNNNDDENSFFLKELYLVIATDYS